MKTKSAPSVRLRLSVDKDSTPAAFLGKARSKTRERLLPRSKVSVSNAENCSQYWTEFHAEKSSRLWLPTETVLRDLDSSSSSIWSSKAVEKSWFSSSLITAPSTNLSKIFSPSLQSSLVECRGSDDIVRKSKKIRIYPTPEQKRTFERWFGASRYAANKTIEYLRQPETKAAWKTIKKSLLDALPEWADETPFQIKSVAIREICRAVSAAKEKFKKTGQIHAVKYKSRKAPIQSCYLPKTAVKQHGIYPQINKGGMDWSEPASAGKSGAEHDCRLVRDGDRWYVCFPVQEKRTLSENQGKVVALDPGIRTFTTFYSEEGCGKIGTGDFSCIQRLCAGLDNLISRTVTEKKRFRRQNMQRAARNLRERIRNLIDELHHKTASFLVKNFDVILLPTFETKDMTSRARRRIGRKSVRSMLTFAHYRFKQFLKHKAFEHGKIVLDVNEAWTSKTISWTGEVVASLGGAKKIRSAKTGDTMDRDYNGARGIFLRALGDEPFLRSNLQDASAPYASH